MVVKEIKAEKAPWNVSMFYNLIENYDYPTGTV